MYQYKYNLPVTVIKISFPPSKCNTKISYNLSWPLFILYADLLSTKTSKVISHFSPNKISYKYYIIICIHNLLL